jgi:hypothetical protein
MMKRLEDPDLQMPWVYHHLVPPPSRMQANWDDEVEAGVTKTGERPVGDGAALEPCNSGERRGRKFISQDDAPCPAAGQRFVIRLP